MHENTCIIHNIHQIGRVFILYFPDSRIQILSYSSWATNKKSTVLVHFQGDQHLGLEPHKQSEGRKRSIKVFVLTHHILTHARFTIRVSINLSIVLYDWETGWQRRNLFFTLIRTGAAAGVLTTTVITVKHPE